ncbi:hypothetical protein ABID68_000226 [Pseudarthrobacter sp. PvP022]
MQDEPLQVGVLGTQFVVGWGQALSERQRTAMRTAWKRCAGQPGTLPAAPPLLPTETLPFSAVVAYRTKDRKPVEFHLQSDTFEALSEQLTSQLTLFAIMDHAGEFTMLHACGLADPRTGAVVALVAKSGTGKTTAASALSSRYAYVTDETVAIRSDGSVVAYPKPLSVKQTIRGAPKLQVGPDELGLLAAPSDLSIQSIVLLDRVAAGRGPVSPVLQQVPLADAVLALIPESSSQGKIEQPLQALCRLIDRVGGVWKVSYSEAEDLAKSLAPLFEPASSPGGFSDADGNGPAKWTAPTLAGEECALPDGRIRRAAALDAVAIDGDLLVLLESGIVRLSGIAPTIWSAAARSCSMDELSERTGDRHGRPKGYRALVEEAVDQLIFRSILECGPQPVPVLRGGPLGHAAGRGTRHV